MNFSICLIARNEEKTLPRLLESLKEFQEKGGEVLLLDTGSTDNTANVAEDFGCIVYRVGDEFKIEIDKNLAEKINDKFSVGEEIIVTEGESLFDYSAARNYIAQFAKNNMIAMPDCDEIYTKLDVDWINQLIKDGAQQFEYSFVFSHDEEGNELVKFLHSKFYNRNKLKWTGVIHEVLTSTDEVKRIQLDESIIKLEHYQNHETNRSHYLTGLALDCYLNPENDRNAHYFGRELLYRGLNYSAIKQLYKHVDMDRWPAERSQSMIHIAEAYFNISEEANAKDSLLKAFEIEPGRREPLMKLAEHYYRKNQPQLVASFVAATLIIQQGNFYANFQPYYENLPHELMYWALWQLGDINGSRTHFNACYGYQPYNSKYLHDLRFYTKLPKVSFIIPTLGREEGLKRCIESIKSLNYPLENIQLVIVHDGKTGYDWENNLEDFKMFADSIVQYREDNTGVPKTVARGLELSTGEWIVYASNDTEFTPDSLIIALETAKANSKSLAAFNTGEILEDKGNICEHFLIKKSFVEKIGGEIFDTDFYHVGVDNLLWAKADKQMQAMRVGRAIVTHHHFTKGAEFDDVYKKAWREDRVKHDRELLAKKLEKLNNPII